MNRQLPQTQNRTFVYSYDGTNIVAQEVTNGTSLDYEYFFYDASGSPVGMNYLGNNYLFKKNLQGDIIEIWGTADGSSRSDFRKLVTYTYDAWGNITSMVDTTDNWYRVGTANPFRYRGYYYDNESGLYYVSSRYYDPKIGRFINSDVMIDTSTVHGFNLFTYCGNNPIMFIDPTGYARIYVIYYNNPGSGFYDQAMNSPYYNSKNKNVYMIGVTSNKDFINAWNSMRGTIESVFLYLHGGTGMLCFKGESLGFSGRPNFSKLNSKKVKRAVYLFSCKGGAGSEGNNVAWMFAKLTNTNVYACTGGVSYSKVLGKYYARKAWDMGFIKTFYYGKRYIFWGDMVAKSILGQW